MLFFVPTMLPMEITHNQACRLAAESGYNIHTIFKWAAGRTVSESTRVNLAAIAAAMGIGGPVPAAQTALDAPEAPGGTPDA